MLICVKFPVLIATSIVALLQSLNTQVKVKITNLLFIVANVIMDVILACHANCVRLMNYV